MDKFDDLARRLRARVDLSANRERSLDWKAADAIEQFRAENEALVAENKRLDAENRTLHKEKRASAEEAEQQVEPQEAPPALARALDLREAAALLNVSYSTLFTHKEAMGFFQVGSQWRIWPEQLRQRTSGSTASKPVTTEAPQQRPRQQADVKRSPVPQLPMSARRAEAELNKIFAEVRKKRTKRTASKTKNGA